jgi:D-alanyl-lipoteichoic acid acyltransferase DltB (MBOAT superfamily)
MLFNSFQFVFAFLPLALAGWWLLDRIGGPGSRIAWLTIVSVLFYGLWNPVSLLIITPSILLNFFLAKFIQKTLEKGEPGAATADRIVYIGVFANLLFLGFFKYWNFFVGTTNDVAGTSISTHDFLMPLGISFITFQKIGFLMDVRSRIVKEFSLPDFLVFVFFFPQLIAGPIVHYREMVPQFHPPEKQRFDADLALGFTLFSLGLFKKVILADGIAKYANGGFSLAAGGGDFGLIEAWAAALAYTLQIYFDFSGYSDMAIGLARMFGVRLPLNFNSPLRASSIIDFWSRWHMTLTTFLTTYVYTPVVMRLTRSRMNAGKSVINRKKVTPEAFVILVAYPTILTMFLSGFWHGAGFTFLVWGLLHGVYLVINHAWRQWRPKFNDAMYKRVMTPLGWFMTFIAVVVGMVFFRADSVPSALRMLKAMVGLQGVSMPEAVTVRLGAVGSALKSVGVSMTLSSGTDFILSWVWVVALLSIALLLPNGIAMLRQYNPVLNEGKTLFTYTTLTRCLDKGVTMNRALAWLAAFGLFLGLSAMNRVSEFLYWQF